MDNSNKTANGLAPRKPISLWIIQATFVIFVLFALNGVTLVYSDNIIAKLAQQYIFAKMLLVLFFMAFAIISIISIISIARRKKCARWLSFVTMLISIPLLVLMTLMTASDSHSLKIHGGEQVGAALFNDIMILIPVVLMLFLLFSKKIKHYLS